MWSSSQNLRPGRVRVENTEKGVVARSKMLATQWLAVDCGSAQSRMCELTYRGLFSHGIMKSNGG